jgi:hypothetical protein
MKNIRRNVFETNSSSTHSLSIMESLDNYLPESNEIIIDFIDTDEYPLLCTLQEKISYLVSHIINKYKYDCEDYDDLIELVKHNYDFKRIEKFVKDFYDRQIVFPKTYKGNLENIVNINHQLICDSLDEILDELIRYSDNLNILLDVVLKNGKMIAIGRD